MGMCSCDIKNLFFTVFFLFICTTARADLANSLYAWYKFDEASSGNCTGTTVLDSSGNGRTGTCNTNPNYPTYITGPIGKGALHFANTTGNNNIYVSLPFGTAFTPTAMTVTAWVYSTSWAGQVNNPRFVASDHTDTNTKGFQLMANNGATSGFFDIATAGGLGTSTWNTTTWPTSTWIFYAGVYDGTHVYAYAFWTGALRDTGSTGAGTGAVGHVVVFQVDVPSPPAVAISKKPLVAPLFAIS